jgi:hypothetical protein
MSDFDGGSPTREIASLQVKFKEHPDLADLTQPMKRVLAGQADSVEVVEVKIIEPTVTSPPPRRMQRSRRILVGATFWFWGRRCWQSSPEPGRSPPARSRGRRSPPASLAGSRSPRRLSSGWC